MAVAQLQGMCRHCNST